MKPICLFFFLLVLPTFCSAQTYYFKHYQVEQGLSNNTVYTCLQDKKGFLWLGTKDGLNRFDGYTFKVFRHNPHDKRTLANNMVHALSLDKDGSMWVGTDQGVEHYNPNTETFTNLNVAGQEGVRCIMQDSYNNCWFIAGPALMKYDKKTKKITNYKAYQNFEATSIAFNNGNLWVSTTKGTIEKLNPASRTFTSYSLFDKSPRVASNYIEKIFYAGKDKIFIGTTNQGFKEFDCVAGTYIDRLTYNADKTEVYVRDFNKYSDDEYWIATESGLFIYNTTKGTFTNIKKRYNDPYSLSDNALYVLYKDIEGGVWAGTYFGGINYYPKQHSLFRKYYPGEKNTLQGNVVREISKDQYGNFWLGTEDNGLNKLSADKNTWTHYYPGASNGISNSNIHGLLANGNYLYIGTFERGLNIFNIKTGKVEKVFIAGAGNNALKSNFIVTFLKTRAGVILVATTRGLYRYNLDKKDFTLIDKIPPVDFVYSMIEDHNGKIWLGTVRDGIYVYDINKNTGTKLAYDYPAKGALNTSAVNGVFEDSNNNIWFATEGLGLWFYDTDHRTFKYYDNENGLPSNYTFKILEDNNKNIWVSTSRGLISLNLGTNDINIYTKANGLLSDQFNYNSAFKDTDGTMYFGCVRGMVSFNPALFTKNAFVAPVYITGFQVHNKEITVNGQDSLLKHSIICTKKIKLNYNQSSFSIDFASLSFPSPEMTQYKYIMKGLDHTWTTIKANRKVYFTQLSTGHYTFTVKAANNDGNWTNKETTIEIDIAPPFWKSAWAYMIYSLFILATIYYLLRSYHRNIRQKNQRLIQQLESDKEKELYNAKIEFFTNVAHEIRTPLTLIKAPMEKVMKRAAEVPEIHGNLQIMERNTDRLLDLTNQLLDFRKTETNGFSLNFVKTNISELLKDAFLQFKTIAEQKNFSYTFNHPDKVLYAFVDIEAFTKIISNLINNAIKYASSEVNITLFDPAEGDTSFTIVVKNDGYLVPMELRERIFEPFFRMKESEKQTGTGIGLSLSRSLSELHKGFLFLSDPLDNFNIFTLTLPIHQDKEFDLHNTSDDYEYAGVINRKENFDSMKPIILLVDDNPEILDFVENELTEKYAVIKAMNGQEALDRVEEENIQLVICDVMMPVIDGFEFCKRIKTNFEHSHIPVILLTARNTLQSKIEGLEVGADAYIEKPFSPEHLQVQIANLLINRNKIKDYFASSPLANIKTMAYSKPDESFLDKLNTVIYKNMQDAGLDVEHIANLMNMSKPTLYRKVKAISNLTINELINITRLKAAAKLLENGDYKIYEVANMVGYSSQSHLGRNFLKQFGTTPTEYQQSKRAKAKSV
ncbi:signal transduction histidine kinase/ligand-binding sensor domain-containing protein/DNA-binding response OmpR family regulator [Mucilaginibacter sp. UYNi724]